MNAGQMRAVVRLEQRSSTQDAAGEPVNTWSPFIQRRAEMVRTPGREAWSSGQRQGRVPTLFRMRYHAGVLPAMRLLCNSKVYDVLSVVDPTGKGVELLLTTEELVEASQ